MPRLPLLLFSSLFYLLNNTWTLSSSCSTCACCWLAVLKVLFYLCTQIKIPFSIVILSEIFSTQCLHAHIHLSIHEATPTTSHTPSTIMWLNVPVFHSLIRKTLLLLLLRRWWWLRDIHAEEHEEVGPSVGLSSYSPHKIAEQYQFFSQPPDLMKNTTRSDRPTDMHRNASKARETICSACQINVNSPEK